MSVQPGLNILQRALSLLPRVSDGLGGIVSNIGWLFADKFIRIFISLGVSIWVARYLGPEQFGYLSYAQNFVVILAAVAGMGVDAIVLRELSKRGAESNLILGSALAIKNLCALLIFIGLFVVVSCGWVDKSNSLLILVISISLFFQGFSLVEVYFQSLVKSKYIVFFSLAAVLLSSLLKVALIVMEAELFWFAVSLLLDGFLHAIALLCCYRFFLGKDIMVWAFRLRESTSLLKDSWSLMVGGLAFVAFYSLDFLIIEAVFSGRDVGIYAAAFRFFVIWHFVPGVVINSFKPSVVRLMGTLKYQMQIELVTGLLLWFSIFMFIVVWLGADFLIEFAYGADYDQAADILRLMIFANIFVFFFSCWNSWHIIEGRSGYVMVSNLLAVFIKLSLVYLFLEDTGMQGLVYFGVLGMSLSFIILSFGDKKTLALAVNSFLLPFRYINAKN